MSKVFSILAGILRGLVKAAPFLLAYYKGRKDEEKDFAEAALEAERINNSLKDVNKVKSDQQILNELKERDTRDEA